MISAEKKGIEELQKLLVKDINELVSTLANENKIKLKEISGIVCAGNTAMGHFLLGLPTDNIRRTPYIPASVEPRAIRASEVGININPLGLLYSLPGISGWVGSDITAGILATQIFKKSDTTLLIDIGTNGEVVIGNKEWLVAASASAGPALEGASVNCGMRAEQGAIESVCVSDGVIKYKTIGNVKPKGICGSGIIDIVCVLLNEGIINRSGKFLKEKSSRIITIDGLKMFTLVPETDTENKKQLYFTESDIEHVITAKAAIYAAMKIILRRLDLDFTDINRFYIAGAFGNYINIDHAVCIGLLPDLPRENFEFVGNTSMEGAKLAAFHQEAFNKITEIRNNTTYYDLMGADDYVEEFRKAMFLPHTDIEEFSTIKKKEKCT